MQTAQKIVELGASTDSSLMWISKAGRTSILNDLHSLKSSLDLNPVDVSGKTPVMWAAINGHFETVCTLTALRADVSIDDHDGFTSLAWASKYSHLDIVQYIRELGVDINQYLFRAIRRNQPQVVREYCFLGADIDEAKEGDVNPLTMAVKYGKMSAARQLRTCNASLMPCLEWAVKHGRKDCLQVLSEVDTIEISPESAAILLESAVHNLHFDVVLWLHELSASVDTRLEHDRTTLIYAADKGRMDIVGALLDLGSDINWCDVFGCSAIDRAAYRGDTISAQTLLEFGASLDRHGRSALIEAARQGHVETAATLLSFAGTQILNFQDEFGCTPLMWGASKGNSAVVKLLLDKRALLEQADCLGRTALIWAALEGNCDTLEALCAVCADLEAQDNDGYTPLTHASSIGCDDTVLALHSYGADLRLHDGCRCTALVAAVSNRHANTVKLLCRLTGVYHMERSVALLVAAEFGFSEMVIEMCMAGGLKKSFHYSQALTRAAVFGNTETVLVLHALSADVDFRDSNGCTALMWAASNGHTETVQSLLDLGARLELCCCDGLTAMQWAANYGNMDTMQALHKSRADYTSCLIWAAQMGLPADKLILICSLDTGIDECDADGMSPLGWALDYGQVETARALLEFGADGSAALLHAACTGRVESVRCALELGVSCDSCNDKGVPVLVCAIEAGQSSTAKELLRAADMCLLWAAKTGSSIELIETLVSLGGSVHAKDGEGRSVLGWAVYQGHFDVAKELCRLEACPGQCLLWAASCNKEADIKTLLAFRASINTRDECGRTAIMMAILQSCSKSVLHRLLNTRAGGLPAHMLNEMDNSGCTALSHALLSEHESAVKLLLGRGARLAPCLNYAVKSQSMKILQAVKRLRFKFASASGARIFGLAATIGNLEILCELHNLGAGQISPRPSQRFQDSCTWGRALILAAGNGKLETVKLLISFGASVQSHDSNLEALQCAAAHGHTDCVVELVCRLGASIDARNCHGQTALFLASQSNQVSTVQKLCELKANVDLVDESGFTALMAASREGHFDTVSLLCTYKANSLLCCLKGTRAITFAAKRGHHKVAEFLEEQEVALAKHRRSETELQWIWACCIDSGLAKYSSTDTAALEMMYSVLQEAVQRNAGRFTRRYLVYVLPEVTNPEITYVVDVENMMQRKCTGIHQQRPVLRFLPPLQSLCVSVGCRTSGPGFSTKLVNLDQSSEEFFLIKQLFCETGAKIRRGWTQNYAIVAIQRVENLAQFNAFQLRTTCLRHACGEDWDETTMIQWLFHGTADANIDAIIYDNVFGFKPLLCQRTSYGKGTYFSKSARYSISSKYCSSVGSNGLRRLIVAAVALGRSALGHSKDLFPPQGYHSSVDDPHNPTIFVVPDGASAYPGYVISFK